MVFDFFSGTASQLQRLIDQGPPIPDRWTLFPILFSHSHLNKGQRRQTCPRMTVPRNQLPLLPLVALLAAALSLPLAPQVTPNLLLVRLSLRYVLVCFTPWITALLRCLISSCHTHTCRRLSVPSCWCLSFWNRPAPSPSTFSRCAIFSFSIESSFDMFREQALSIVLRQFIIKIYKMDVVGKL